MLQHKELLQNKKNLLAFSAGGDSTALFFLLLEQKIPFDIAIVNYGLREQAKEEVAYAKSLAKSYSLQCHTLQAPALEQNFEANARQIRYDFFEELIKNHSYENLLTAHHLGDRLEWMLMQFCKGAGCVELSGMQGVEQRENYALIRPLLTSDKEELIAYLKHHKHHYFEDASNSDEKYKRNSFRKHFAQPLLAKYKEGIKKSFRYLDEDKNTLAKEIPIVKLQEFAYFQASNQHSNMITIDRYFKSLGKLLSAAERELLKTQNSAVIGRKYIVQQRKDFVFIAPFVEVTMEKRFKEKMRLLDIEPKLRGYISQENKVEELLTSLLA